MWFMEVPRQFSICQPAQRLWILEKPITGYNYCLRILLSCFRNRTSASLPFFASDFPRGNDETHKRYEMCDTMAACENHVPFIRDADTVLPAYCDTVYCDKLLILTVLAIPIPKGEFYTKKFADIVTFFVKFLVIVTILAEIRRKISLE